MSTRAGALTGLRVIDLTRYIPGPYCTWLLSALGAEVVKIEEPPLGDATRLVPPPIGGSRAEPGGGEGRRGSGDGIHSRREPPVADESALHASLNRGKRSLMVDIRRPEGAQLVARLAGQADVFVEAYRPGALARRGLGPESLCAAHPRLVYCSISGYGQQGPLAQRAGHDVNYAARAGVLHAQQDREGRPGLPGVQLADMSGGIFAALGILAALQARERTGRGQVVDVGLMDSALALLTAPLTRQLAGGPERDELAGGQACYGLYRCRDGAWLAVGGLEPKFWEGLCEALGLTDAIPHQWDAGAQARALRERFERAFAERDRVDWLTLLEPLDVCVEPVLSPVEAWSQDQAAALRVEQPYSGVTLRTLGLPFRLSDTPTGPGGEPPGLGVHADAVLAAAGFEAGEVARLRGLGVLA